ncbi:UDP-4-amino-4,6-dideoxy-N-acetyl-beta-L-altrosamine transaminase [Pseudoalteromonas sp. McH1-42]|uniref:UDP-4-amino-4, 6-dideoxy-N-acetyl-beta-L-altrosamine transaminase n=1 Tax=Pseudoalteromonas sp. McH1-42 TaxID=2917752 RepID=UPI001EF7093B|nr:UDP-4-amino-4,6-dideoxy-N-acetyl-beta-L-altrosamine transaminase [Pseudoalteromonas sp. McH1-42]MCG7563579.1 UDP-4-amino-4,6-dideoxy-N-acetyl-beta-L-altrosamine transaminase [Pseudoalteromonas sp. McH1-42]
MIPYGKQNIAQQDIDAVVAVLQSDFLTQGPVVPQFEQAVARYCQAPHAVAVNSATSALHVACMALDVTQNSLVWTVPNSFVASANCALYCGASVDFVDIDETSGNLCVLALAEKLRHAQETGRLPDVVIPVHFAGQSCDMEAIAKLARQYGFKIIEDASHAIGGRYQSNPVGHCDYSDICVFSFHPVKIITSAEGGMAVTQNEALAQRMRSLRSHGITADPALLTEPSHGPWYYQQQALGFNYRMTDLHAALGLSQLAQLDQFVATRNKLAQHYDALFAQVEGVTPLAQSDNQYSAYHLYVVRIADSTRQLHEYLVTQLRAQGVFAHVHYIPIYLQPYYQQQGFKAGYCPASEAYYHSAITLPLFPSLTAPQQQQVVDTLSQLLSDWQHTQTALKE